MARYEPYPDRHWPGNRSGRSDGYPGGTHYSGSGRFGSYGFGYPAGPYPVDRGFGWASGRGYDPDYKSRWQTDYGDPYGDRQRGTPVRMVHRDYDRDVRSRHWDRYDDGWRW